MVILKLKYQKKNRIQLLKTLMDNYFKGKNVEEELERNKIPISNIPDNFLWMQVKGGSKMTNLISHAAGIIEDKAATAVVWTGGGVAIAKAISCAEILKRRYSIQHQVTKLAYKSVEEYWEPKVDGLETIVVKRQIPVIHILLSTEDAHNLNQLGYQNSKEKKFWEKHNNTKQNHSQKGQSFKYKKSEKQSSEKMTTI